MKKQGEMDLDAYPFTVRKLTAEEGGGYLVEYPDIPLCQSDGDTIEEAIANSRDALRGALMCYLQDGKPLPKPSAGHAYSGAYGPAQKARQAGGLRSCGRPGGLPQNQINVGDRDPHHHDGSLRRCEAQTAAADRNCAAPSAAAAESSAAAAVAD